MTNVIRTAFLFIIVCMVLPAQQKSWRSAAFLGLEVGKSSKSHVVQVLGEYRSRSKQRRGLEVLWFPNAFERGHIAISIKNEVVHQIELRPGREFTKQNAVERFGPISKSVKLKLVPGDLRKIDSDRYCVSEAGTDAEILESFERGVSIFVLATGRTQIFMGPGPFSSQYRQCGEE
jgi:hypothetical protein